MQEQKHRRDTERRTMEENKLTELFLQITKGDSLRNKLEATKFKVTRTN